MRFYYLLAPLLLFEVPLAYAQTSPPTAGSQVAAPIAVKYQFCELVRLPTGAMELDYGQTSIPPVTDASLSRAAARVHTTSSVVSILNYLGAQGWTCIGVTTAILEAQPPVVKPFSSSQAINTVNKVQTTYLLQRLLP
jgi:hypothetical protein